ncbi:PAS domain-containing protein [Litorimonas sp. WD9-15]|uniref:PAS domain-containing protein n=1 Tax=Litorimonas sp. WD9-15 TaxID=3418716 RepID=UPI003D04030E
MRHDMTFDGDAPSLGAFDVSHFFDVTNMSVVISDAREPDLPIIYVNRAFEMTTGYARSFAVGRNCRFMQGEDTDPATVRRIRQALKKGQPVTEVLTNYRADKTPFLNELILTPIYDKQDRLVFYVGVQTVINEAISQDITKDEGRNLVASIQRHITSHLDVIMDISSLADDNETVTISDVKRDFLKRISSLDVLYRDLGSHLSEDGLVDLGAYVSHITSICAARFARFGVRVNIRTESLPAPIDYSVRIGLILNEILENALRHAFHGRDTGFVEVLMTLSDDTLTLSVIDDGTGFSTVEPWPAIGRYGAAVTRLLLDLTGGEISFESSKHGTVIEITSPLTANGVKP